MTDWRREVGEPYSDEDHRYLHMAKTLWALANDSNDGKLKFILRSAAAMLWEAQAGD